MDLPGHEGEELPIPITSTFATAHGHAHLHPSNGLFTPPAAATTTTIAEEASSCNRRKGVAMVTYRECLRNHAAAIGGSALDGCGEFMPSGEEGTLEALKCSACSCHRNFHRKEVDLHHHHYHHHLMGRKVVGHHKGVLISASTDGYGYSLQARPATQMVMPLGALQASDYYWV